MQILFVVGRKREAGGSMRSVPSHISSSLVVIVVLYPHSSAMYEYRNTAARFCNHCYSGKAI